MKLQFIRGKLREEREEPPTKKKKGRGRESEGSLSSSLLRSCKSGRREDPPTLAELVGKKADRGRRFHGEESVDC